MSYGGRDRTDAIEGDLIIDAGKPEKRMHDAPPTPPYSLDPLMRLTPAFPQPPPYPFDTTPMSLTAPFQSAGSVQRTRVCKRCKFSTSDAREFQQHQMTAHAENVGSRGYDIPNSSHPQEAPTRYHRQLSSSLNNPELGLSDDANNNQKEEPRASSPLTPGASDKSMEEHYDDKDESRHDKDGRRYEKDGRRYDQKEDRLARKSERGTLECRQCGFTCNDRHTLTEHKECHLIGSKHLVNANEARSSDKVDHHNVSDYHDSILPPSKNSETPNQGYQQKHPLLGPDYARNLMQRNFISDVSTALKETHNQFRGSSLIHPPPGEKSNGYSSRALTVGQSIKNRSTCTPVREAVDPAKYVTIREPDGVKYACSKCGNIYKWRKSLNKHWKEKHDGEIPDLRSSFTPLTVPRIKNSESYPYKQKHNNSLVNAYQHIAPSSRLDGEAYSPVLSKALKRPPILDNVSQSNELAMNTLHYSCPRPVDVTKEEFNMAPYNGQINSAKHSPFSSAVVEKSSSPPHDESDPNILDLSQKSLPLVTAPVEFTLPPPQEEPLDFSMKSSASVVEKKTWVESTRKLETPVLPVLPALTVAEHSSALSLQCPSCAYIGRNKQDYDNHMELHLRKRHYKCAECQQVFFTINELNKHFLQSHMETLQSKAAMAGNGKGHHSSPEATQLFKYLTMDSSEQLLSCIICGAIFQWQWTLAKHFEQDHPMVPNPYKKRSSEKGQEMPPHKKPCSYDESASFPKAEADSSKHQDKLTRPRNMHCKLCEFSCKTTAELVSHYEGQHPTSEMDMKPVIQSNHGDDEEEHMLGLSGMVDLAGENTAIVIPKAPEDSDGEKMEEARKDKSGSPGLTGSRRGCLGARSGSENGSPTRSTEMLLPFKCTVCDYRARWPSEISQHMKNHSDEKPFLCPRCSYRSKWKWDVVKHLKRCGGGTVKDVIDTTKGKKPPMVKSLITDCKEAGVKGKASSREQLSNGPPNVTILPNMKSATSSGEDSDDNAMNTSDSHSNGQPSSLTSTMVPGQHHYCPQCPFVGNSPAELKRHSRVHSDEKPFICKTCGYSSKWKCDLKKHLRTYNHTSAVPLTYGGHGRKPSDLQELEKYMEKSDGSSPSKSSDAGLDDEDTDSHSHRHLQHHFCNKCDFFTHTHTLLDAHMKMHQSKVAASTKLRCKSCLYVAPDLPTFLQHKLTHQGSSTNAEGIDATEGAGGDLHPRHRRKASQQFRVVQSHDTMYSSGDESLDDNRIDRQYETKGKSSGVYVCEWCNWGCDDVALMYNHAHAVHPSQLAATDVDVFFEKLAQQNKTTFAQSLQLRPAHQLDSEDPEVTCSPAPPHLPSAPAPIQTATKRRRRLKTCHKCGYITDNMTTLQRHLSKHGGQGKFTCRLCDYSVDRQHILQYHMRTVHKEEHAPSLPMSPESDDSHCPEKLDNDEVISTQDLQQAIHVNQVNLSMNGAQENSVKQVGISALENGHDSDSSLNDSNHENVNPNAMTRSQAWRSGKMGVAGGAPFGQTGLRKYRCQLCRRTSTTWAKHLSHQATHKTCGGGKKKCPVCDHKSTTHKLLRKHMQSHGH